MNSFSFQTDAVKRVACIRCRTQKLKCIKSTTAAVTKRCDRCRKADVECIYVPSKPMGRPRTSRSQTTTRITHSPALPSDTTARIPHSLELPPDTATSQQLSVTPPETIDLNTMIDEAENTLDTQNMNIFFDHITPFEQDETSTQTGLGFTTNDMDFLTPCSSHGTLNFSHSSDTYVDSVVMDGETTGDQVRRTASSTAYDFDDGTPRSSSSTMQQLAKLGLDLHAQIVKHQTAGDMIAMEELVADVLRSSTDYLNHLVSLDSTVIASQDSRAAGPRWAEAKPPSQAPQLDMSTAFQLLIPYVRLVQLHNILYRAMLRCLSSNGMNRSSSSSSCSSSRRLDMASARLRSLPALSVGGACVDASDPLRARLLLQMNLHLLAEIEAVLELPLEARICWPGAEGGIGGPMGISVVDQGGSGGLLRQTVSPRLLKTILEERNLGTDDVQSMRDRISYIKCLLRTRPRPL